MFGGWLAACGACGGAASSTEVAVELAVPAADDVFFGMPLKDSGPEASMGSLSTTSGNAAFEGSEEDGASTASGAPRPSGASTGEPDDSASEAEEYDLDILQCERTALDMLRTTVAADGALCGEAKGALVPGESLDSSLLRFLRASSLKPAAAVNLLRAHLAWRRIQRPAELADMSTGEICGCAQALLERYLPTWHQGFDKAGRPVVFSHYGKFRFKPIIDAGVTVENILRLHIHNCERTARLCGEQSRKLGRDVSRSLVILDTDGWDPQNFRKAAIDWAKGIAKIDQEHYVDRMGEMIIINAPSALQCFVRAVFWALPQKTRDQVKVFAGREQWVPALLERVDAEQLPPEYGGCGPAVVIPASP
mmetsp:Transcript_125379/g.360202  ORF Transcript_125379/g.360202 Transcript_125379/m.360202 type:complete len:365 (-) Transcript_125379:86-1180(-)